jgi:triacylglycerol lipase
MNALIQRYVVAALALGATSWGIFAWSTYGAWCALMGALAMLNLQAVFLGIEFFVLLPFSGRGDVNEGHPPLRLRLQAWWRELWTSHLVFSWRQPFRTEAEADHLPSSAMGFRGVLFLHGFYCNRALWNPWMQELRRREAPFIAVTLEPAFGSIDDYVAQIDEAVKRLYLATGVTPLLVGHSMGGLAIRAWWRAHATTAFERVDRVITIGSPHQRTLTARFAHGLNAYQMRPHSEWLIQLAGDESHDSRHARFTCFYSDCDNIAMPMSTGRLEGADNRHLPALSHVALAYAPEVFNEVLRRISHHGAMGRTA